MVLLTKNNFWWLKLIICSPFLQLQILAPCPYPHHCSLIDLAAQPLGLTKLAPWECSGGIWVEDSSVLGFSVPLCWVLGLDPAGSKKGKWMSKGRGSIHGGLGERELLLFTPPCTPMAPERGPSPSREQETRSIGFSLIAINYYRFTIFFFICHQKSKTKTKASKKYFFSL